MAIDAMSEIVHESSEHDTFLLAFSERWLLASGLTLFFENVHLPVAQVCNATAVLKSIVSCSGKHKVVGPKLVNILKPLHLGRIDYEPAVARQPDLAVDDVA
jgi:hypothetical protein